MGGECVCVCVCGLWTSERCFLLSSITYFIIWHVHTKVSNAFFGAGYCQINYYGSYGHFDSHFGSSFIFGFASAYTAMSEMQQSWIDGPASCYSKLICYFLRIFFFVRLLKLWNRFDREKKFLQSTSIYYSIYQWGRSTYATVMINGNIFFFLHFLFCSMCRNRKTCRFHCYSVRPLSDR